MLTLWVRSSLMVKLMSKEFVPIVPTSKHFPSFLLTCDDCSGFQCPETGVACSTHRSRVCDGGRAAHLEDGLIELR